MFKKGQSIVEYVLVLAAIVIAVSSFVLVFVWGPAGRVNVPDPSGAGLAGLYQKRLGTGSQLDQDLDRLGSDLGLGP